VVRQALCPQQGLLEAWPWVLISSHTDLPLQGISSVPSVFSLGDSHSPATHLDHAHDSPSPPPPSWLISRFPSQQWSLPPFCCTRQSLTPPCTPFLSRGHQFYLWASLQSATSRDRDLTGDHGLPWPVYFYYSLLSPKTPSLPPLQHKS
jgi:hypothetical protein